MDWTNERYVRVYVRDTADLLAIGWQGRVTLYEMLRKSDRAGIIDGDGDTLPDLLRLPREVVESGIAALLKREVVVIGDLDGSPAYLIRNFMPAQEAKQSDAQRQRESRARRRDAMRGIVTNCDEHGEQSVTKRNANVTAGHTVSQPVTPSLAVPSCAVSKDPTDPLSDKQSDGASGQLALSPDEPAHDPVKEIWGRFCRERKAAHPGCRRLSLTPARRAHIRARLKSHGPGEIEHAIRNYFDPRFFWAQKGYNSPELVFRSAEQLEKVRDAQPRDNGDNGKPAAPAPAYHKPFVPPTSLSVLTKDIGNGGLPPSRGAA